MVGGSSSSASVAEERDGLAKVVVSRAAVDMEMVLKNVLRVEGRMSSDAVA